MTLESERPVASHPGCVILGKFPNFSKVVSSSERDVNNYTFIA